MLRAEGAFSVSLLILEILYMLGPEVAYDHRDYSTGFLQA